VFAGLCAYTFSVWRGVEAHKQLTDQVFRSDQQSITSMDAKRLLDSILRIYKRSRAAFFVGCFAIAVGVLGFVICNNVVGKFSRPRFLVVSLKNATLVTQDSRKIEIENLSFKITDPRSLPAEVSAIEIQDLAFNGRSLQPTP